MFAFAALLAAAPAVLAFAGTHPLVAWSSHASGALDSLAARTDALSHLISSDSICAHQSIVVVDQPGLHASDLRVLPPSSALARALDSAVSALQLPYAQRSADVAGAAQSLAVRCAAPLVSQPTQGGKQVVSVTLPALPAGAAARRSVMAEHDAQLARTLEGISGPHLVLFTGSAVPANGTVPAATAGGLLARYQFFTTGLLTTLLITFFVLVPALFAGISALASIQASANMAAPKGFNADTKKTQ